MHIENQPDGTTMWYPRRDPTNLLGDGREEELATYLADHPQHDSLQGSPSRVVLAIDEFCQRTFMMNVGARKAKIIEELINKNKPKVMVELGGYIGYSAIAFGTAVRSVGGETYYSIEANETYAGIARYALQLADLGDFVHVEVGISDVKLRQLHASQKLQHIDMLFLDHYKPAYEHDLRLCEELGLIKEGSIIIADDCDLVQKQAPGFFKYIHSSVTEKQNAAAKSTTSNPNKGSWYVDDKKTEDTKTAVGNPNLHYESTFVPCLDSDGKEDGLEIIRCVQA